MSESPLATDYIQIAADIVAAFVSNNAVRSSELPAVIEAVYASLLKASEIKTDEPVPESKAPAVPVKKSITGRFHHLPRRRQEVQVAEAAPEHGL